MQDFKKQLHIQVFIKATSNIGLQKAKNFLAFSRTLCYYIQALCNYASNGTIKAAYDRSEHHEGRHPSQL